MGKKIRNIFCQRVNSLFGIDNESENGSPSGESRYDGTWKELVFPLVGVALYALPSLILLSPELLTINFVSILVPWLGDFGTWLLLVFLPVILGILMFLCIAARSGGQDTDLDKWPEVERINFDLDLDKENDGVLDVFITEYQTVAKEARYRDRLLLRTGYFSLAAFGVLISIFLRADYPPYQTGIAMVGTLISLAFAIAVVSYKDARDPLWERMRVIELQDELKHKLTSFHTIRTCGERRLFDRLSLSSYIITLQIFFLILWLVVYFVTAYIAI